MSEQLDLFGQKEPPRRCAKCGEPFRLGRCACSPMKAPYAAGSETSKAAARRIEPVAGTQRANILRLLRNTPAGMTDDEIQDALGISAHSECPRRQELQKLDLIVDSGRKRLTRAGRQAGVWIAR
jgi:hypothetical protein